MRASNRGQESSFSMGIGLKWNRVRWRFDVWRHDRAASAILHTPPIQPRDDGVILFSMIGTAVLNSYLVAVKSLHNEINQGRIMLLNDGTLTAQDRRILAHHCGDPVIIEMADIEPAPCPRGNCWERLMAILQQRGANYVIQLDSDIVVTGPVPEIVGAIAANRSFTLGGDAEAVENGFMTAAQFVQQKYPCGSPSDHVQHRAESNFANLPDAANQMYIRGCAGFAGFSRGQSGRSMLEAFSQKIEELIGPKWHEWGSEQIASNFVIANDTAPLVLPYDRYVNHWDTPLPPTARLIHFIGTHRYDRGNYVRTTRDVIARLSV
jgi:hypothetical protein